MKYAWLWERGHCNLANYQTYEIHREFYPNQYRTSMSITEFASLQLKEGKTWEDILPYIRTLSHEQANISGFRLYFFDEALSDNTGMIYLLSGWVDVSAHEHWIASDMNQRLLRDLGPLLEVRSLPTVRANLVLPDTVVTGHTW